MRVAVVISDQRKERGAESEDQNLRIARALVK
jgi:hypothetical protein